MSHQRVLLVSKAMRVASTHTKAVALGEHVDLTLCLPNRWPGYVDEGSADAEGFDAVELPISLPGRHHLHTYRGVGALLDRVAPDLVHIDEEPYSLATAQWVRACRRRGIPTLAFTWQNIHRTYPPPFANTEAFVYRNVAGIQCGNEEAQAVVRRKGFTGPTVVIPQFGIEPSRDPREDRPIGDPLRALYLGRLAPEKGIDVLLRAVAQTPDVTVDLVGSGPEEAALRELGTQLGVGGRLRFHGPVPSTEVGEHLARADVLVLPSRTTRSWKEQFGRVLIEAMAVGTIPIGSDSGEIPTVIGDAGLVFPEDDVAALALCLRDVRTRPDLRRAGVVRSGLFTTDVIASDTLAFYDSLLDRT